VTDTGCPDLDQHFAFARSLKLDGGHFHRLAGGDGDCGANVHGFSFPEFSVLAIRYRVSGPARSALAA
jgi:hypothetical protein